MNVLFLNSFAWISFKIDLCDRKKMASYKNVHHCFMGRLTFKDLMGKILPKSRPFQNWEILLRKTKLLYMCFSFNSIGIYELEKFEKLRTSPNLRNIWHLLSFHHWFYFQRFFYNLKCNPGSTIFWHGYLLYFKFYKPTGIQMCQPLFSK